MLLNPLALPNAIKLPKDLTVLPDGGNSIQTLEGGLLWLCMLKALAEANMKETYDMYNCSLEPVYCKCLKHVEL